MTTQTLIDTGAAAQMLAITANAVRILAHRHPDRLPRRGRDEHGRTLYALADVEAEAARRGLVDLAGQEW